jgi:methylmalonyl-CoA mutase cobalamin-binding subunit
VKVLNEMLKGAGLQVVHDGHRAKWTPDDAAQQAAVAYGKELAGLL